MSPSDLEILPDEQRLALAHTPAPLRLTMRVYFALDRRLSQLVGKTTEPMLGQMRLAWWRDMLAKPEDQRPNGDAVLDVIGAHWKGRAHALIPLVDAWEILVAEDELTDDLILKFGRGRGDPLVAHFCELDADLVNPVSEAAAMWALSDAASHIADDEERARFVGVAKPLANKIVTLPHPLRGLAVLRALSLRALEAGGAPLMQGRSAALVAFRAGLFGR